MELFHSKLADFIMCGICCEKGMISKHTHLCMSELMRLQVHQISEFHRYREAASLSILNQFYHIQTFRFSEIYCKKFHSERKWLK